MMNIGHCFVFFCVLQALKPCHGILFIYVAYKIKMKSAACRFGFFYVLQALKPQGRT